MHALRDNLFFSKICLLLFRQENHLVVFHHLSRQALSTHIPEDMS